MRTYKINSQKADEYEQILFSLQKENDQLKNRKISSTQFKAEQKKLYKTIDGIKAKFGGKAITKAQLIENKNKDVSG